MAMAISDEVLLIVLREILGRIEDEDPPDLNDIATGLGDGCAAASEQGHGPVGTIPVALALAERGFVLIERAQPVMELGRPGSLPNPDVDIVDVTNEGRAFAQPLD